MNTAIEAPAKAISVKLSTESRELLSRIAATHKRSQHSLVVEAVDGFLSNEADRLRRNTEALESWHHYEETGLHITGDELFAWMDSWGTANEQPAPKCHV